MILHDLPDQIPLEERAESSDNQLGWWGWGWGNLRSSDVHKHSVGFENGTGIRMVLVCIGTRSIIMI